MIWTVQIGRAVLCDVVAAILRRPDSSQYEDVVITILSLVLYPSEVLATEEGVKSFLSQYVDIGECFEEHVQKVKDAGST